MARYRIASLTRIGNDEEITLERVPGPIAAFFGARVKTTRFLGSCTVWHEVPTGRRPGTLMEGLIADLVVGHKMSHRVAP